MEPTVKAARSAGALYLLSAAFAGIPLIYVQSALVVVGDAGQTVSNILASPLRFSACMVSEQAGAITFVFTVRALYRLLGEVNRSVASLMVTLVLISVPITFINVLFEVVAQKLLRGVMLPHLFDPSARQALAMLLLAFHEDGVNIANIFWGLWLLPFGVLVIKSGFIPRILGVLLVLNGGALMTVSLTALFLPDYLGAVTRFAIFPELGELWIMGWLLIKGVRLAPSAIGV